MSIQMLHTCVRVKNLEHSLTFYQQALGLKVIREKDFKEAGFKLVYLSFPGDHFELELTHNYGQKEPYDIGNGYGHLAIGVDDLEATYEKHKQAGYSLTDLKSLPGDNKPLYYFIKDPEGYQIEIIQNNAL